MTIDSDFQDSPIGLIPKDWDIVTLTNDNQAEVIMGQSPPGHSYNMEEMGIPFFQGNADFGNLYPIIKIYTTQPLKKSIKDDILVSVRAPVGEFNLSPCDCSIGRGLAAIRIRSSDLDLKYLYYHLKHQSFRLCRVEEGTTFKAIKKADLYEFLIARPTISEQRNISEILDTVDRTITQTEQLIEKLRAIKSGLLHDLLTRGIGEDGRVRDPEKQPEEFKESEVGLIPKDWSVRELDDCAYLNNERFDPLSEAQRYYIGLEHIEPSNPNLNSFGLSDETSSHKTCFSKGDILFGKLRPYLRKVAQSSFSGVCSTDILVLRPKEGMKDRFLLWLLSSEPVIAHAIRTSIGTKMPRTSWELMKSEKLPIPSVNEQIRISYVLDAQEQRITSETAYLSKLMLIKKGLMHDLLTGKARVKVPREKGGES